MKALILAAGLGTRLAPITDNQPKCMTEVIDGKTIIQQQIISLLKCGISDITIVTGYKSDLLIEYLQKLFSDADLHFVESVDYAITNNMYSAYLGMKSMGKSGFVMMNADVFFDESVLQALLDFPAEDAIVTDIGKYNEESMKVVEKDGKLIEISKAITEDKALGSSIDVYKFSEKSRGIFFAQCENYIVKQRELKKWSEVALNDILLKCSFIACPLRGRWFEIDSLEDLAAAKALFVG